MHEWTIHPAKERPKDALLAGGVCVATCVVVTLGFSSLLFTVLAGAFLMFALAPFFFPTHYTIDDEGVRLERGWNDRKIVWQDVRRVAEFSGGCLLSPFSRRHWLERYRGMVVQFGEDRAALAQIKEKVSQNND